jgi:hypothetical protein
MLERPLLRLLLYMLPAAAAAAPAASPLLSCLGLGNSLCNLGSGIELRMTSPGPFREVLNRLKEHTHTHTHTHIKPMSTRHEKKL